MEFIRVMSVTHVRTLACCLQLHGNLERHHNTLWGEEETAA